MKNWIKENQLMTGVIAFILVVLGISANEFLFTKDCENCLTGLQTLKQEGLHFWGWAIGLSALSGVITYFVVKYINKESGYGVKLGVVLPILIFLSIAWGKGCTDKANNASTTEKGNPLPVQVDSFRISADSTIKLLKEAELKKISKP